MGWTSPSEKVLDLCDNYFRVHEGTWLIAPGRQAYCSILHRDIPTADAGGCLRETTAVKQSSWRKVKHSSLSWP